MLLSFLGLQLYGPDGYANEASLRAVLAVRLDASPTRTSLTHSALACPRPLQVRYNSGEYTQPDPTEAEWARAYSFFAPYNRKLYAWLDATDDGANTAFDRWEY